MHPSPESSVSPAKSSGSNSRRYVLAGVVAIGLSVPCFIVALYLVHDSLPEAAMGQFAKNETLDPDYLAHQLRTPVFISIAAIILFLAGPILLLIGFFRRDNHKRHKIR